MQDLKKGLCNQYVVATLAFCYTLLCTLYNMLCWAIQYKYNYYPITDLIYCLIVLSTRRRVCLSFSIA